MLSHSADRGRWRLQDTVALVTGASSSIGKATARALAAEGAEWPYVTDQASRESLHFNATLTRPGALLTPLLRLSPVRCIQASFGGGMLDLMYVVVTVVFFMAMLLYVRGCNWLGRPRGSEGSSQ